MFELYGVFIISLHDLIMACPFDKYFSYIYMFVEPLTLTLTNHTTLMMFIH